MNVWCSNCDGSTDLRSFAAYIHALLRVEERPQNWQTALTICYWSTCHSNPPPGCYYLRTRAAVDAIKFTVDAAVAGKADFGLILRSPFLISNFRKYSRRLCNQKQRTEHGWYGMKYALWSSLCIVVSWCQACFSLRCRSAACPTEKRALHAARNCHSVALYTSNPTFLNVFKFTVSSFFGHTFVTDFLRQH